MEKRTRLKGFIQKPDVIKIRGLQAGKKNACFKRNVFTMEMWLKYGDMRTYAILRGSVTSGFLSGNLEERFSSISKACFFLRVC